MNWIAILDKKIFFFINHFAGSFLDYPVALLALFTQTSILLLIVLLFVVLFARRHRFQKYCIYAVIIYGMNLGVYFLKELFSRPRPFLDYPERSVKLIDLFGIPISHSFPSGHSTIAFASATLLVGLFGARLQFLYGIAVLVALGRIYMGVHYPSDILVGAFLGTAVGHGFLWILKQGKRTKPLLAKESEHGF